ncbi:lipoyl(octanoyl) transferase LipB [Candidatus Hydrogenosomobacter endosymbioticus]|uniref:Octanoyltransferase n=1 Tax=Candidatus Hydrogenosomobacter endosymbioticus TaxID=2558174 RepID=A0ABM7V863_9PROT|nr:lipoyl(octanoyl) transferase LipB [Candidatus Hydrogenosomobacter endosymbioticus]BDB95961.1 octanoyltransferase [Candidatus Hydrogenosomobacter endosymbioticus]
MTKISLIKGELGYQDVVSRMKLRADEIASGADEEVWLIQHSCVYTVGARAAAFDELCHNIYGVPVCKSDRGGLATYHGPGQRVCYAMINLRKRGLSVRDYIFLLEEWIISALKRKDISANRNDVNIGAWVDRKKIASIGVHVSKGVSSHGFALNVCTEMSYFEKIIPCGILGVEMTSIEREIGENIRVDYADEEIINAIPF